MTTTIDERGRRHRHACGRAADRHWYRPRTAAGRLVHRGAHVLFGLFWLAVVVTLFAMGVAAMVAAWQWMLG